MKCLFCCLYTPFVFIFKTGVGAKTAEVSISHDSITIHDIIDLCTYEYYVIVGSSIYISPKFIVYVGVHCNQ